MWYREHAYPNHNNECVVIYQVHVLLHDCCVGTPAVSLVRTWEQGASAP